MNSDTNPNLESLLDTFGTVSPGHSRGATPQPPAVFIGRVRRRRMVRHVTRMTGAAAVAVLAVGIAWISRSETPAQAPAWTYTPVVWPPTPSSGTGGPVEPLRAGIRPDDPRALAIIQ